MEIISHISVLFVGIAIGTYISSQIEKRINKKVREPDRQGDSTGHGEIDTKNQESLPVFKEDAVVKKIWNYTYVDENGNKIELPKENKTTTIGKDYESDEVMYEDGEPLSQCCGYKIHSGTDICSNPECLEHTGIENH
tara:strand:- start:764 stop:1177 length:414 start_codon:yes stop_codon:yes gene_type:complete